MLNLKNLPPEIQEQIGKLSKKEIDDLFWEDLQDLYDQRPVDIDTFLDNPYFMGEHFADPATGKCKIYPFWRETLREIYPSPFYNRYNEVLVMLGIGNGKSTVSNISCLYEIYKLLCMKDPQSYYKLLKSTIITFVIFSANKYTAENVNWPQLKAAFEDSPWFQEHCPIVDDGKRVALDKDNCVSLPKNVAIQLGSNEKHALGKAVIWGVVDEANFQSENSHQAYNSYNAIAQRRTSRFQEADEVPGVLWIVSSPKSDLDFVAQRIESQRKIPTTLVIKDIPSWEIKKDPSRSGKTFPLFIGDTTADPKILSENDDISSYNPTRILNVPVEFRLNFEKDLIKAIMDIAGRSSVSDFALFPNANQITSLARMKNRVNQKVVFLSSAGADEVCDFVDQSYFRDIPHKNSYRYIHVDIGLKNDWFAMSGVYSYEIPNPEHEQKQYKGSGWEYEMFSRKEQKAEQNVDLNKNRIYVCEFILYAKNTDRAKEVPLLKIIRFINWLKSIGYPIKIVSYDMLGRGMFSQMVSEVCETKYLSVDRDKEMYLTLKQGVSEGIVLFPDHPILIKELRQLRDTGKKIDHPPNTGYDEMGFPLFSKDGADALCGAVFNAMTDDNKQTFLASSLLGDFLDEPNIDYSSTEGLKSLMREQMHKNMTSFFL